MLWVEPVKLMLSKLMDKRPFATTECCQHWEAVLVEPKSNKILKHWSLQELKPPTPGVTAKQCSGGDAAGFCGHPNAVQVARPIR